MEWDQRIFRTLWHISGRVFRRRSLTEPGDPDAYISRLNLFANLVADHPVQLIPTNAAAALDGDRFLLPLGQPLLADENESLDFLRCCILLAAESNRFARDENQRMTSETRPLRRWRTIFVRYPMGHELFRQVAESVRNSEREDASLSESRRRNLRRHLRTSIHAVPRLIVKGSQDDVVVIENTTAEERALNRQKEKSKEHQIELPPEQELLSVDHKEIEDYTLTHNFEKIETADEFDGRWRDLENDDNLDESAEALQEVKLGFRIRTTEAPDAVLSADVAPADALDAADTGIAESGVAVYFDEWDYRKKAYRRDHCRVFVRPFRETRPGFAARVLARERQTFIKIDRRLQNCYQELETVRRQTSGDDPDPDAVIAALADIRAGRTPPEQLYLGRRKRRKNITLHFLLDLSLSTDAYVAERRVLDVEREALVVFGEVLERHDCRFAVSAFYSRTRNDCVYMNLKQTSERWQAVRDRIGAIAPCGYTRMGPAIRRSIEELSNVQGGHRWLVLFTDGRPNDYDRYEGRYGVNDVRQAVREAAAAGIQLQTFAVDRNRQAAFHEMLGSDRYRVLREPADLPDALGEFFLKLIR